MILSKADFIELVIGRKVRAVGKGIISMQLIKIKINQSYELCNDFYI